MKKTIKLLFLVLVVLFLILFLDKNNHYYENEKILTDEAIARFEEDLKEGKEIVPSNYITEKKEYNNKASKIGLECSKIIEKIMNKLLKKFIESLEN